MGVTRWNLKLNQAAAISGIVSTLLLGWSSANGDQDDKTDVTTSGQKVRGNPSEELGIASYYADKFQGNPTASGEIFDMHKLTAAHRRYAFGTRVKVTHLGNNRSVIVRINDRGPFIQGRAIDLSLAAAKELQMVRTGLAHVKLEILK